MLASLLSKSKWLLALATYLPFRPGHDQTALIITRAEVWLVSESADDPELAMLTLAAVETNKQSFLVQKGRRSIVFIMQLTFKADSKRVAFVIRHRDSKCTFKMK